MISLEQYLLIALATFLLYFVIYVTLNSKPQFFSILGIAIVSLTWPYLLFMAILNGLISSAKTVIAKEQS